MAQEKSPHQWQQAAAFAARAHQHQLRKDGRTPYVAHVYRVAMTVRDVFGSDDPATLCAALLHDTIEDTRTDYDAIAQAFGADIADMVAALTKNMLLAEREREAEYESRLAAADWRVRLVKLADVYDNLCDRWCEGARDEMRDLRTRVERCGMAIRLATPDASKHPETAMAINELKRLVSAHSGPKSRSKQKPGGQRAKRGAKKMNSKRR